MNRSSQNSKSDGEQLFSCGYRKSSTMTDPYPTGPVVYILRNGKSLYVGATIDLSHRIRQHNGELSGGAHRTSTKGPGWVCLLYVQGFQSRTESLQFEYALKREAKHHGYSTQARKRAVHALLSQEHPTTRSDIARFQTGAGNTETHIWKHSGNTGNTVETQPYCRSANFASPNSF